MALVMLNALDPVRHSFSVPDRSNRRLHAEVSVAVRILFGDQIVIPEPYAMDSLGFLELSRKILDARRRVLQRYRAAAARVPEPFVYAPMNPDEPLLHMAARRIEKGPDFILSGWEIISDDERVRAELAKHIRAGDFDTARAEFPDVQEQVDMLEGIGRYFAALGPQTPALEPFEPLTAKIDKVRAEINITDLRTHAAEIRCGVEAVEKAGIKITDRSRIRRIWKNHMGPVTFYSMINYVDACYNDVLSESARARNDGSTSGLLDADTLEDARSLTNALIHNGEVRHETRFAVDAPRNPELADTLADTLVDDWDTIWEICAQPEWHRSVMALQASSTLEAQHAHVELLRSGLRRISLQQSGRLLTALSQVLGPGGDRYGFLYQEGTPDEPPPGETDQLILGQDSVSSPE